MFEAYFANLSHEASYCSLPRQMFFPRFVIFSPSLSRPSSPNEFFGPLSSSSRFRSLLPLVLASFLRGKEFIAEGVGSMAGVISGHSLDTLKIRLQQPSSRMPALSLFRKIVTSEGPSSLYKGMGTPLASVAFQACERKRMDLLVW